MVAIAHPLDDADGPPIRRITHADLRWALRRGWEDFAELRGDMLIAGFVYPVAILVVAGLAMGAALFPLLLPIVGGLALLGPVLAIGFYELARRRESDLDATWTHFLDPFRGTARGVWGLGALVAILFVAWLGVAWQIYEDTVGTLHPQGLTAFFRAVIGTPEGWSLIVIGNLVGLAFAIVTLALTVVTGPLLIDGCPDATTAVATSLRATRANPVTVLRWGGYLAVILVAACIPLFVGLAIALPVLGYASWHLYTRLIDRSAPGVVQTG